MTRAAAAALVLLVACGSPPAPTAGRASAPRVASTPATAPPATTAPQAAAGCGLPWSASRRLLLATLQGSTQMVVRDVTDINNPKTLCGVADSGPGFSASFAGAGKVIYSSNADAPPARPHLVDLGTGQTTEVGSQSQHLTLTVAASPDGTAIAYLSPDDDGLHLHLVRNSVDTSLASYPPVPAADWYNEWPWFWVGFSGDGSMIASYDGFGGSTPQLQVHRLDGSLAYSALSNPMDVTWSGNQLYFNYPNDPQIYRWAGGARGAPAFVAKGSWILPEAGPAGSLAYHWRDRAGVPRVEVVGSNGAASGPSSPPYRRGVRFVGDNLIWYAGEKPCGGSCGPLPEPDGKTYLFDLTTGTEYTSALTAVYDVWPRPDHA